MANVIRIEHGSFKGLCVGRGFCGIGSRITTSFNRGVLFNVILNRLHLEIAGLSCADFCCGSGIVGLELLSLGCSRCVFVDSDRGKLNNIDIFLKKTKFNASCVYSYLPAFHEGSVFDLIFFDPPYKNNFCQQTLDMVVEKNVLVDGGLLILETKIDYDYSNFNIICIKELKNGAKFVFLERKVEKSSIVF